MRYLVDTDRTADYLNGQPEGVELLRERGASGLAISIITYGEIYEGIYTAPNSDAAERGFRQFLRWVTVLPLEQPTMRRFARIRGDLRRRGLLIGDPDLLIAATALEHRLILLTRNRLHFERIPRLRLG
jgi:tRNA(fMet)-specific endonuclease VapC